MKRITAIADRDPATPPDVRPSTENRDDDPGEDNAEVLGYDARSILIHRQADCRLQILEMYYCKGKPRANMNNSHKSAQSTALSI
jgi:hypothetical protein